MLYQLPNGKIIYLTVEEFLGMDDRQFHELVHSGYGDEPSYAPFYGKQKLDKQAQQSAKKDMSSDLDYTPDSDETDTHGPLDLNNLPEE